MAVTLFGALWLSAALETRLMATDRHECGLVLSRLLRAGLFVLALPIALTAVGIDHRAVGVRWRSASGWAWVCRRSRANYVGGFATLLERSFRAGDSVKIDSFEARSPTSTPATRWCGQRARARWCRNEMFMVNRVENLL